MIVETETNKDDGRETVMKNIKPLHTHADYERALQEIESYFKNVPVAGSEEADRFDVLSALLAKYEDEYFGNLDVD
jgi:HTH-type transcriptional regulator / antitoxin HigA